MTTATLLMKTQSKSSLLCLLPFHRDTGNNHTRKFNRQQGDMLQPK